MNDEHWMRLALAEAEKALANDDVPIGALAVRNDEIIGRGYNRREADQDQREQQVVPAADRLLMLKCWRSGRRPR